MDRGYFECRRCHMVCDRNYYCDEYDNWYELTHNGQGFYYNKNNYNLCLSCYEDLKAK